MLVASLGESDDLIRQFDHVRYTLSMWTDQTPASTFHAAHRRGVQNACGIIEAAIYQLRLAESASDEAVVDVHSFDAELWDHVRQLVELGDWGKVAAQTAIFVENHVRTWAGDPKDKNGNSLVGKALYLKVFADDGVWRLGGQSGEWEGWRYLGMGFAQALGNVDRHRIQKRPDARQYAIGVLGLGSLLLTQMRYQHPELVPALSQDS
ncbi:TIGR02391 family protein [Nocardia sp. NPDC050413]|uniref:TIGR02391 family protein n=1 Tax=Nocardia sp. NPDC050413 TaxID=3155784 RepID=UPI0033F50D5A